MGSPENIRKVMAIVLQAQEEGQRVAVVVSAFAGVTNTLLALAEDSARGEETYLAKLAELSARHRQAVEELVGVGHRDQAQAAVGNLLSELERTLAGIHLLREATARARDAVASFGERLSATIMAEALHDAGVVAEFLDARQVVLTDERFGNASVSRPETEALVRSYFAAHPGLQMVTGFIGATRDGVTTTLGRGGSDYTAAIFGAALGASVIEIWTDVDGVLTADPRVVPQALPVRQLTYEEAMELSHFGAKVIYPPTMVPAMQQQIPLVIKNTFHPDDPGTIITERRPPHDWPVTGVTSISAVSLLRVEGSGLFGAAGTAGRVFATLAAEQINVLLISQASSEHSICFAVEPGSALRAKQAIEQAFAVEIREQRVDPVIVESECSVVAVVGEQMRQRAGIAATVFNALGSRGINVIAIAQGSSEINISIVVKKNDQADAVRAIHDAFFVARDQMHLYVIGTGLIGGTLLQQLGAEREAIRQHTGRDIRVMALANSTTVCLAEREICLDHWRDQLTNGAVLGLDKFIGMVRTARLPRRVLVDCTASSDVANRYEELLSAGVSIVTPNKIANTGSQERYDRLRALARRHAVGFVYDTNVGAGLPVISTLQDLVASGDRVISIEGVFSGTMSYLFNTFMNSEAPFSELVREAKEKGYTEPDPRDDLRGADVGRKALILARESGWKLEPGDVQVQGVINDRVEQAASVDELWAALPSMDADLEEKKKCARDNGTVLRYLARVAQDQVSVRLVEVGVEHPSYHLSGAANIFIITTERYKTMPLVIRGPGAGAEVTAAGVLADIIRLV